MGAPVMEPPPTTTAPIRFDTDDGLSLEGEVRFPDGPARGSAVLCHPHPRYGGSKDHPLLWAIRIALARSGFAVLSFNFRGVMGSQGSYEGGVGEVEDVRSAVRLAREVVPGSVFVAGWSFGAHVALREALDDERVRALALVGLPFGDVELPALPSPDRLKAFERPVLLVAGDADPFCPVPELLALAGRIPRATVEVLRGASADHYFPRREREVAELVARFAQATER